MEMSLNGTSAPGGTRTLLEQTQLEDCMTMAWTLLCTFLVVSMQLGFAMLEVGSVREAHRMTVLAKNVLDSVVSCMVWWARSTFWHTPSIVLEQESGLIRSQLLMFHWAICATCVTICSGAMAERTHMVAYLFYSAVMAGFIYPVIADSAWGREGLLHGQFHGAWSGAEDYRFHDFSGSGVCHMTGGVSAFIGNMLLGRRILKPTQAEDGGFLRKPIRAEQQTGQNGQRITLDASHSVEDLQDLEALDNELVMAIRPAEGWKRRFSDEHRDGQEFKACNYLQVMGMFTLWFGWYGFNAGLTVGKHFSHVAAASMVSWNTSLAACSAGFGAYLFCYLFRINLDISFLANGVLCGLVAITGPCDVASDTAAVCIGLTAGLVVYPASSKLLRWLYLDDPVDAIAVHAFSGLFGVIAVGFCRPNCQYLKATGGMMPEQIRFCDPNHDRLMQMYAQAWGAFTIIWFTVTCSFFLWSFFVVSELVRSMEVPYLAQADDLLIKMTTPQPSAGQATSEASGPSDQDLWRQVVQWSPAAQRILHSHGWQAETGFPGGAPQDHFGLRMELHKARAERETALEIQEVFTYCPFWTLADMMHRLRFFRVVCQLRLRIAPVSELSGLGAADADGGQFFIAVRKALAVLQDIQTAHSRAHLPLKREVRDLSKMIKHQDAALRRLSQGRSGGGGRLRSMPRLSSVPEQPTEGQPVVRPGHHEWQNFPDGDTWSASGRTSGTPSVDIIMPTISDSQTPSDASTQPAVPQPRDNRQFAPAMGASMRGTQSVHSNHSAISSRTVSDRSAGMLTPHSTGEDTPPPTVIGRLRQATRVPPALQGAQGVAALPALNLSQAGSMHDVVGQLSIMVQAQQELLGLLQQATPPVNGVQQGASPGHGGISTPNRQHLLVALENVARQQDNISRTTSEGFSNVSTQ